MDFSTLVLYFQALVMWCSWSMTVAAPTESIPSIDLRDAKQNEIIATSTAAVHKFSSDTTEAPRLMLRAPESFSNNDPNTWEDKSFLDYMNEVMMKVCPTMAHDSRKCKTGQPLLSSTEQESIKAFFGGETDGITCAQLIDTWNEDEPVGCVLYVYDRKAASVNLLKPSLVT